MQSNDEGVAAGDKRTAPQQEGQIQEHTGLRLSLKRGNFVLLEQILADKPKGPLYHYCSQSGLMRIVEQRYLSATDIHYFNDAAEIAYAVTLLEETIGEILSDEQTEFKRIFIDVLASQARTVKELNVFVFCLSEQGDLLSQWRAYCPKEGGYSIGFDFSELRTIARKQGFSLVPCIYEPETQRALLKELLQNTVEEFASKLEDLNEQLSKHLGSYRPKNSNWTRLGKKQTTDDSRDRLDETLPIRLDGAAVAKLAKEVGRLIALGGPPVGDAYSGRRGDDALSNKNSKALESKRKLLRSALAMAMVSAGSAIGTFYEQFTTVAPMLKHPGFSEEQEWRLVSRPRKRSDPKVDVRQGPTMFVPYLKFPFLRDGEQVKFPQVNLGPTVDAERALSSLKWLLLKRDVLCPEVHTSSIPYRNW